MTVLLGGYHEGQLLPHSTEELTQYLERAQTKKKSDLLSPVVTSSGRARCRSKGGRFPPCYRVGLLAKSNSKRADILTRTRTADVIRYDSKEARRLSQDVRTKQVHGVVLNHNDDA